MERLVTQPSFVVFRPPKLQVLVSRPRFVEGQSFEFGLGSKLVQEMGSSAKGSKNPTTQISKPKFMEEVVAKVMQVDKATESF